MYNPFPFSDTNKRYHTYDYYLKKRFGTKCCKIPLDGGFTCPNRDGSRGVGGCTYCSARGSGDFTAGSSLSVAGQFEIMKQRSEKKWADSLYIPYFQAYTNTYAPLDILKEKYEAALALKNTVGLAISTRADCLSDEVCEYLHELSERTFLTVELGLQTAHDETARLINRCHTTEDFIDGYEKLRGINVVIHLINGLPGETKEMMLETAKFVSALAPFGIKLHLLHLLRGTEMARQYEKDPFHLLTLEEYVDIVVSQLELMPPETVIERVTGDGAPDDLIGPLWSRKKFVVMNEIDKLFVKKGTWQGFSAK